MLPNKRAAQDPPLRSALPPCQTSGRGAAVSEGSLEPGCEGAATRQQKGRSWDPAVGG